MPIVDIEIVLQPDEILQREMVSTLADRLGEIFESPKGGTWVKVRGLAEYLYDENGRKEEGSYPVFVSILKSKLPAPGDSQKEVMRITEAVATICKRRPENVHILYLPEGRGRVVFGGRLVT